jgi:excisionase family DNA binding protein
LGRQGCNLPGTQGKGSGSYQRADVRQAESSIGQNEKGKITEAIAFQRAFGRLNVPMEQTNSPSLLGQALLDAIRQAVKEAIREANGNGHAAELLTPEDLANRLKVPVSWVYEQSRQGKIPTHRLGRYIRFDLAEVLANQKKLITS